MTLSQLLLLATLTLQPSEGYPESWYRPVYEPEPSLPGTIAKDETNVSDVLGVPLSDYTESTLAGFRVLIDPAASAAGRDFRRARAALLFDLERVVEVLPPAALERVQRTPIVLTLSTPGRPGWDGASAACLHVSEDWLVAHGYDAERAGVVEILHMDRYVLWRAEQPMMLLHELAHAYHLSLPEGYDHAVIGDASIAASRAHLYDAVPYILADDGDTRPAYASTNPQEYFAELTEAYFGRNDYYPFTREDLAGHDPGGYAMIEEVWGVGKEPDAGELKHEGTKSTKRGTRRSCCECRGCGSETDPSLLQRDIGESPQRRRERRESQIRRHSSALSAPRR